MSKKVCEINILGTKYAIRSEATERSVREIETYLNDRLQEVLKKSNSLSVQDATVLAAMNIAGEYLKLKETQKIFHEGVVKKSKDILSWIDNQLENVEGVEHWV